MHIDGPEELSHQKVITWRQHLPFPEFLEMRFHIFLILIIVNSIKMTVMITISLIGMITITVKILFPKSSMNRVNRWDQVGLVVESLLTKHMWSHVCVFKINKTKSLWTVHVPVASRLKIRFVWNTNMSVYDLSLSPKRLL